MICPNNKSLLLLFMAAVMVLREVQAGPVIEYLNKQSDLTTAAKVLKELMGKREVPASAKFTLLAPTNEAIEAFRRDMRLTPAQFNDRKGLLDLVVAYHVIPGYQAKELKLEKSPAVGVSGDINYLLRFINTDKGVDVEDLQGNKVALSKPVVIGNAAVIKIDRVLMSGSYFFDGKKALSYYPQWSEASKFADAVGYPEGTAREADSTFFVPNNKAMQAVSGAVAKMSKEQQRDVFLYHVTSPARTVPQDFQNGKIPTNLKGQEIEVNTKIDSSKKDEVTGRANIVPSVTLTSTSGNKANINIFNVFVGKSMWQGIDAVLVPSTVTGDAKVQTEGRAKKSGNHRRSLMRWGGGYGSNGVSQQYANTVAADNTAQAIEAAATGKIPTSYATRYGSFQADAAAAGCVNCLYW